METAHSDQELQVSTWEREAVRCPQKNYLFRGKLDQDIPSMARAAAGALGFLTLIFLLET